MLLDMLAWEALMYETTLSETRLEKEDQQMQMEGNVDY